MELVDCSNKYWEFVRKLRINSEVINNFINQNYITKTQQQKFMKVNNSFFKICLKDKSPVGYIGLIGVDKDEITLCVEPQYQSEGIGSFMLKEFINSINKSVWSKVKKENYKSVKLFIKLGFKEKMKKNNFIYFTYTNEK